MNYLSYSSAEMFSSTELIRKSKMIFDKVSNEEIEKAVILRDGKPSFMLLDFHKYETIMNEYIRLKTLQSPTRIEDDGIQSVKQDQQANKNSINEIEEQELEEVLAQIDKLDVETEANKTEQPLKEFWD